MKIYCIKNKKIVLTPKQGAKYFIKSYMNKYGSITEDHFKLSSIDEKNQRAIYNYDKTTALQ